MKTRLTKALLLLSLVSLPGQAAVGYMTARVVSVLVDDIDYAGCMVRVTQDPTSVLATCGADWLTLDCAAVFPGSTKSGGASKLSQAQLGLITGRSITFKFTDAQKANGKCLATRLSVN